MSTFIPPIIFFLIAVALSRRIVLLKRTGRECSRSLSATRYTAWFTVGFSLAIALGWS